MFAPAGTPKPIVERLNAAFAKAMKAPDVHKRLIDMAVDPDGAPPQRLAECQTAELAKWATVVKAQGIRPD